MEISEMKCRFCFSWIPVDKHTRKVPQHKEKATGKPCLGAEQSPRKVR